MRGDPRRTRVISLCFIYTPIFTLGLVGGGHQRTRLRAIGTYSVE